MEEVACRGAVHNLRPHFQIPLVEEYLPIAILDLKYSLFFIWNVIRITVAHLQKPFNSRTAMIWAIPFGMWGGKKRRTYHRIRAEAAQQDHFVGAILLQHLK